MMVAKTGTSTALLRELSEKSDAKIAAFQKRRGLWQPFTWGRLVRDVGSVAAALTRRGVGHGDRVLLIGEASIEWLIADFAIQWSGGASVTPYPDGPSAELAECLAQVKTCFAFVDGEETARSVARMTELPEDRIIALRSEPGARRVSLSDLMDEAAYPPSDASCSDEPATVCFTAGSGGSCRASILTHRTLMDRAQVIASGLQPIGGMGHLRQVPPAHVAERVVATASMLLLGGVAYFPERVDTIDVDMREVSADTLSALPWQWERLRLGLEARIENGSAWGRSALSKLNDGGASGLPTLLAFSIRRSLGLGQTRMAISHGAALDERTGRLLRALGLTTIEGYGVTELGGWSLMRLDGGAWRGLGDHRSIRNEDGELAIANGHGVLRTGDRADEFGAPAGRMADAAIERLESHLAAMPMIHRAVASAQAAVLEIDHAKVRSWALAQGLPASTFRSLAALPELRALLSQQFQSQSPESPKIPEHRVLAPDPFNRADGLLTATGTVRRDAVLAKFIERAAIGEEAHAVLH